MITINNLEDFKHVLTSIDNGDYSNISLNDIIVTLYQDGRIEFNAEPEAHSITLVDNNTLTTVGDWDKIFTASSYDNNCEVIKEVIEYYWNEEGIYLGNTQAPLQCNAGELSWMIEKSNKIEENNKD